LEKKVTKEKFKVRITITGLMPAILATQGAEIKRIVVQSQPGQKGVNPTLKKLHHKNRSGGVTQGVGTEFKFQYRK
jgi:hypothetical protein